MSQEKFEEKQCCFCGKIVAYTGVDPGILVYTPRMDEPYHQELFCHARCLGDRLHPSVPFIES